MSGSGMEARRVSASYWKDIQPQSSYLKSTLTYDEYCEALKRDPNRLKYIPAKQRSYELCKFAMDLQGFSTVDDWVRADYDIFPYLHADLITEASCLSFLNSDYISKCTQGDWSKGIPRNGRSSVDYMPFKSFMKWESVCLLAVSKKGIMLAGVPKKYITREICETAFSNSVSSFEYIPAKYKTKEMCIRAVQYIYNYIRYVPATIMDKDICKAAMAKSSFAYKYIPEKYLDEDVLASGARGCSIFLKVIPPEYLSEELCRIAVEAFPETIKCVPEKYLASLSKNEDVR